MTTKDFKTIDYKEYKMSYETKIASSPKDIVKWGPLIYDNTGIFEPCIFAKADGDKLMIEFNPDSIGTLDKTKAKMTGIIIKHFDKFPEIECVMLNDKFIPIGHKMGKTTRWIVLNSIAELMKDFNIDSLYNFISKKSKDTSYRLWAIDNTLFYMSSVFVDNALATIILDQYCDSNIPVTPEVSSHDKVSFYGFALLYRYLWNLLGLGEASEYKVKSLYQVFDEMHLVPNIPTYFNLHHIEDIKYKNLTQFVFDPAFDKELEELDVTDFDDSQFPLALGNSSGIEIFDEGVDYFSLKKLINLDVNEEDLIFVWSDNYPVLIDSGIKFKNKFVVKEIDIRGAFLNAGLLELVVSDDIFDEKKFDQFETDLEETMKELFLDGVTIYPYASKMGEKLASDYAEFVRSIS